MSFKREGDDRSQLNVLKKRRVADLLSNYIPEDEATIMNNGRYTCLVCSYGPVFDTVDTLTVHRNGKRHLEGFKRFYRKKAQLRNEIAKRKQENYVQSEDSAQEASSSAPLLAQTKKLTHHALLKTVPYNSCHRRTSTKSEKQPLSGKSESSHNSSEVNVVPQASTLSSRIPQSASADSIKCVAAPQSEQAPPMSEQRRRELEHHLQLKSAGWIQDGSGQWLKDENVEFDSDEEEPPSLST
uniref:Sodium channel modifier 1 n=1 Tax=Neogobius melanostomus TaxID=47308 RepID=A0A8C6SWB3_9GOBI